MPSIRRGVLDPLFYPQDNIILAFRVLTTKLTPTLYKASPIRFRSFSTMKAIIIHGKDAKVEERSQPKLRDDYLLVKTVAIALNPTDWKHIAGGLAAEGGISGCDFSGYVEEVGSKVTKQWKKGDKIAGVAHGANYSNPEDGAFAEYVAAKGDVQMKMPDSLSFEQAATVSLGAMTCGQGLYEGGLGLNLPTDPTKNGEFVLIYGGSTATGSLGVQYAKLYVFSSTLDQSPVH